MSFEPFECIDGGTEFCPCHLGETGNCIQCRLLQKDNECNCSNWKGVCIYQELKWNNGVAKNGRKYFQGIITEKVSPNEDLFIIVVKTDPYLVRNLTSVGSFVFLKSVEDRNYFDSPISIMDINTQDNELTLAIEIKGVKTYRLNELKKGDKLLVKGPYWNGVLGLRHIKNQKGGNCILISRGIGQAPLIPILKDLYNKGNKVTVIIDNGRYPNSFITEYLNRYASEVHYINTFERGKITEDFRQFLINKLEENKVSLVHSSCADILNYDIMKVVEEVNKTQIDNFTNYTCCNNTKMCCGEGICGCCTRKNNDHKLRRLCKMQTDPKYVLEGRRLF
ncbi:sulfide/dihydroorotate dehydrogenase-like FAD/NAD-binding protein [Hathewaya histolytica]|uniref:2-polyprenylphenol hydroxylase-like oxidoreductase n=1 Tax=Hathewaya histolytica TaxID=1498 RepID=A0A4U9R9S4_HATHI|nr:sulfide/dihydroorotate dehydrogenase-like FAD/NAD-binding protein [Hathewaya histolytica]VTQ88352.1 2-polyprenylphenol hydroxylase-like oxidoreductase [Hathewaya histolytica]